MIRTYHHRFQKIRHLGEDLWSKRAKMGYCSYTTYNKFLTRRRERAQMKEELHNEVKDYFGSIVQ